ncbi:EamA family transporter [Alkalibaculum sp. M08DMB]|uniref:EamA family transporter n=1 Tax=Alkalibaculum sporogenes TaxID=2655001 RepID=A0A6A7KCP5_9FIRM|nr:DMT family transporter [Alkalibaculum sporogenes]MPW26937.1 EamA family transporter [Alkalibaculum sporogenes]
MNKRNMLIGDFGLLMTAFVWGSGFVAVKNALDSLSPMYIMVARFSIATLLMGILFHKKVLEINKSDVKAGIVIGLFLFFAFASQTIGLQYTLAGKQAFLTATNVIMVPFLFWVFSKERPDKFNMIAAILMIVGIGLLTLDLNYGLVLNKGDLLTLLCAFLFACHIISVGYYAKKHDPIKLTVLQFAVVTILSILFMFIFEKPTLVLVPANGLYEIIFLGLFSTFMAFLIQNIAQKYTTPSHTALILSLEAFFGSILSVIFLGDLFNNSMILGSSIIFIAIITAETKWSFLKRNLETVENQLKVKGER